MDTIVISLLGSVLDNRGKGNKRWERWRPTLAICQQQDLAVSRLYLLYQQDYQSLADQLSEDIARVAPQVEVVQTLIDFRDAWDFESVYATLHDFSRELPHDREREQLLVHITTGTHVAQICLYLLTEAHYLQGKLLQTAPPAKGSDSAGSLQIIDLDLSCYDRIASRFSRERLEGTVQLKHGIETRNTLFNRMIAEIENIAIRSSDPVLLTGPTGVGKSQLAIRIFELRKQRKRVEGRLVQVNCATLRGEHAMSALFGHVRGAYTGAVQSRAGLIREADNGLLFLDEIGELGMDEQAMLLHAIENKVFIPVGSDQAQSSNFQLIAGTNRDLYEAVRDGLFREDLLARINLWTFSLPPLRERLEDIEPNLEYELERFARKTGTLVSFNAAARRRYLQFAISGDALWTSNFRDLNASITRMSTLAPGGRITEQVVHAELNRLRHHWHGSDSEYLESPGLESLLTPDQYLQMDLFDRLQLEQVIHVCRNASSAAEAGRKLFNISRARRSSTNDSHRLRQYLSRHGLSFKQIHRVPRKRECSENE